MARVTVHLPGLLTRFVEGRSTVGVQAATIEQALGELVVLHPSLAVHLFDETGGFRRHVLCFHNRTNTRWLKGLSLPLADGDTITILQAVSGG